jgi:hypothetical protein
MSNSNNKAKIFRGDQGSYGIVRENTVVYEPCFSKKEAKAVCKLENSENPPKTWAETKKILEEIEKKKRKPIEKIVKKWFADAEEKLMKKIANVKRVKVEWNGFEFRITARHLVVENTFYDTAYGNGKNFAEACKALDEDISKDIEFYKKSKNDE